MTKKQLMMLNMMQMTHKAEIGADKVAPGARKQVTGCLEGRSECKMEITDKKRRAKSKRRGSYCSGS